MKEDSKSSNVIDVVYGKFSIINESWQVYFIDDGFSKITGYTQQDVDNGLKMLDFIPKEDLDTYLKSVEKILSVNSECYLEHRISKKSGEKVYVLCFGRVRSNKMHSDIIIADVTKMVKIGQVFSNVKSMLNTLIQNVPSGIAMYEISSDKNVYTTFANDYYWQKLGYYSKDDLLNNASNIKSIFTKTGYEEIMFKINEIVSCNRTYFEGQYKLLKKDGYYIWTSFKFNLYNYKNSNNNLVLYIVMSDITEARKQISTINYQNERYQLIQNLTNEIFFEYDFVEDTITLPKNVVTLYTGKSKGDKIKNFFKNIMFNNLIHPDDHQYFVSRWTEAFKTKQSGTIEFRMKLYSEKSGYQWCKANYIVTKNDDENPTGLFGKIVDINESHVLKDEIKSNQDIIKILSSTDTITGLDNKTSFCKKFDDIIRTLDLKNKSCAIVSMDINDFSYVNDNFGYEAGNAMLVELASIFSAQNFYILNCRVYSDFFYCLAYTEMSKDDLIAYIEKINEKFDMKQKLKYPASNISLCTGMYFICDNTLDSTICMDNSNLARRSIKNDKFIKLALYNDEIRNKRSREKAIASELNEAIQNDKIQVFLQPKFDMKTFKIIGAEALARWRNDDNSFRSPATFIPILENLGYVIQLDFYIYEQVLRLISKWQKDNINLVPISVNFSRIHNNYDNFVDRVVDLANKYNVDKSLIEIEITESAFANNNMALLDNMQRLRNFGFKIDIDDFGIGYSSLSILLDAPVDIIKLDKKFIDDICNSSHKQDFLKQLCLLIQTANKNIIFEGVELKEQANFLCECGFYMAQGWLFEKAIPSTDFEKKYIYI